MRISLPRFTPFGSAAFAFTFAISIAALLTLAAPSHATQRCVVASNSAGNSADMPPQAEPSYHCADGNFTLGTVGGLSTYTGSLRLSQLVGTSHLPGGSLGGTTDQFTGGVVITITGSGYSRVVTIPISLGQMDHAPRALGARLQPMAGDLVFLQGQLPAGDPDFDLLRISAGSGFGMPSPGHTTLTRSPGGNWNVDSFFDITYRIDFVGHPGGPFGGMSNSSTSTARFQTGSPPRAGCPVPDIGGTAALPPRCDDGYVSEPQAVRLNGLPPGVPVTGTLRLGGFSGTEAPGGSLGGTVQTGQAKVQIEFVGDGPSPYRRTLTIPVQYGTESGARAPGSLIQSCPTELVQLQGQITGDPDFDLLRISAGSGFGMPSPGHTTLRLVSPGGPYAIDSFFDITYRLDFVGHPGGPFGGLSGSNTGTALIVAGATDSPVATAPDHGGTALFPVDVSGGYHSAADALLGLNGLPPGTPITGRMSLTGITSTEPLGGATAQTFSGKLVLDMSCALPVPYSRTLSIPVTGNTATTARTPGAPVQSFENELALMSGRITGDPDFDLLRITAGGATGLPGGGCTTFMQGPGTDWTVDSFFDITYRIDFIGRPGGPFAGMSGSTDAVAHLQAGDNQTVGVTPRGASSLRVGNASPNPAFGISRLTYSLDAARDVDAGIFDIAGRNVKPLAHGRYAAGEHSLRWDGLTAGGSPAAAGLYFYRLRLDGDETSRKVILQR